jgi:hypothetical protein
MVNVCERRAPHLRACQRYLQGMALRSSLFSSLLALLALVLLASVPALASAGSSSTTSKNALLKSPQLWATIDVCSPTDQPDTVGIRGSMPANGQPDETMYMRFRLQYLEPAGKRWVDLTTGSTSNFVAVGGAKAARQAGQSLQLVPVPGKPAFNLRGVVSFQWRKGTKIEESVSRPTTAGHQSLAGADPVGFSAATCSIG